MGAGKSKQPKAGKAVSPQPMNNGFGAYPLPPQQQNFGPAYPGGPGSLAPAPGMPLPPQQQFIMPPPQQQFILPPPQQQQNFGPAYPGGPGSLAPAPGMPMSPQGPPQQLLLPGPGLPPPGPFQQGPAQFGPAGFPPQGHHHHHHHHQGIYFANIANLKSDMEINSIFFSV
jgi:hypothetical protein